MDRCRIRPRGLTGPACTHACLALLVTGAFLMTGVGWGASRSDGPTPLAMDLAASVSGERITETIITLQQLKSREFHLNYTLQAAQYIHDELEGYGLDAEYQEFLLDGILVSNIVAVKPPAEDEGETYLFGAHYDSENEDADTLELAYSLAAPGADDDASGIAVVLELARLLADEELNATVKFVAFVAEEYGYDHEGGLAGSRYFVAREIEAGVEYEGVAILDMVGYRAGDASKASLVVRSSGDDFAEEVEESVDRNSVLLDLQTFVAPLARYSDHESFWEAGYPAVLVSEEMALAGSVPMPVNPNYHTANDTLDTLSTDQIVAVTQALIGTVTGDSPSGEGDIGLYAIAAVGAVAMAAVVARRFWNRTRKVD